MKSMIETPQEQVKTILSNVTHIEGVPLDELVDKIVGILRPPKARTAPKRANGTGSVYKLSGNRTRPWIARVGGIPQCVMTRSGLRVNRRTWIILGYYKTKSEAEKALAMQLVMPVSAKHRITFQDLYEEWSDTHFQQVGEQAKHLYNGCFKLLKPLHDKVFSDIRTAQFQNVFNKTQKSHSYKTSMKALLVLMYKYAMENDICHKNYAQFIKLDRNQKKEVVVFTDTEIRKLEKSVDIPWVDTILMLIYSGFRIQEFLNLTVFDVDFERGTITGGLKTENGRNRIVPIHPKTKAYWKKYVGAAIDFLFARDGKAMTAQYYRSKIYYPILEQLGIPKKTPHKCRDTFATLLAKEGADKLAIQQMMGHSDYSFTANNYTAKDVDFLTENIKKI